MATLQEIYTKLNDSGLRNRVEAACLLEAKAIVTEDAGTANHAERLAWAKRLVAGGGAAQDAAQQMMHAMIAASPDQDWTGDPAVITAVGQLVTRIAVMDAN